MINEVEYNIEKWASENLGDDFSFRENQLEIIAKTIRNCINDDEERRQVQLIQAPTGTGKSIILIVSACVLAEYYNKTSYLLCSDLSLWKQYDDFIDAHQKLKYKIGRIKGAANYVCTRNNNDVTKADCKVARVSWKSLINPDKAKGIGYECARYCPYIKARKLAMQSSVTIMTYQLFFRAVAGNSTAHTNTNAWYKRDVLFCDECHNIPDLLQNAWCPSLKDTNIDKLVRIYDYALSQNNTLFADEWQNELTDMASDIGINHNQIKDNLTKLFDNIYDCENDRKLYENIKAYYIGISLFNGLTEKISKKISDALNNKCYISNTEYEIYEDCEWQAKHSVLISNYLDMVQSEDDKKYMVVTPSESIVEVFNTKNGKIVKKKVRIIALQYAKEDYLSDKYILDGPSNIVMTSATIGNIESFKQNLGISESVDDNLPSLFDFTNSPIYVLSRWKMSRTFKDQSFPSVQKATYELCNRYSQKKGIIQTWTYDIAKRIYDEAPDNLKQRMLLYNDSKEKRDLIEYHKSTDMHTILIGPTLNEGIDLPGDDCRFILMLKVPYPFMGSKLVKKKAEIYDGWYNNETLRTIIQSIGRGIRYNGDWCQTYILDGCFSSLYFNMKKSFPLEMQRRFKFYS